MRRSQPVFVMRALAGPVAFLAACRLRLVPWLLSLFLALGPVHWLPGTPAGLLRWIEWMIIGTALGMVFATELAGRRHPFPRGLLGPAGFAGLVVLWVPGLLRAPSGADAFNFLTTLTSSVLLLWCFFCVARRSDVVWAVFRRAALVSVVLAAFALANELSGSVIWSTSGRWVGENFGGLNMRSTAWSIGLVLFLPLCALWVAFPHGEVSAARKVVGVAGAGVIVATQFASGARISLLVGLLAIAALVWLPVTRWLGVVVAATLLLGAGSACLAHGCGSFLRAGDLAGVHEAFTDPDTENAVAAVGAVDQFMSRRLVGYFNAAPKLAENPLFGHGLNSYVQIDTVAEPVEVHNDWLRWAVYTGVSAPILLAIMAWSVLRAGKGVRTDERRAGAEQDRVAILLVVVCSGLVVSLLEVGIENAQTFAVWWAAAGAVAGVAERSSCSAGIAGSQGSIDCDLRP